MPKIETVDSINNEKFPYSAVTKIGDYYHFSGVVPKLDKNNKLVSPGVIVNQTKEVLGKIVSLLKACGLSAKDIYGVTVMLVGTMDDFPEVNKIYAEFFTDVKIKPRRKAFAVAALPFDSMIEIEVDAVKQD